MHFTITYDCRECGHGNHIRTDTSDQGQPVPLKCRCGHVSGELAFQYTYKAEHRPSWENESPYEGKENDVALETEFNPDIIFFENQEPPPAPSG